MPWLPKLGRLGKKSKGSKDEDKGDVILRSGDFDSDSDSRRRAQSLYATPSPTSTPDASAYPRTQSAPISQPAGINGNPSFPPPSGAPVDYMVWGRNVPRAQSKHLAATNVPISSPNSSSGSYRPGSSVGYTTTPTDSQAMRVSSGSSISNMSSTLEAQSYLQEDIAQQQQSRASYTSLSAGRRSHSSGGDATNDYPNEYPGLQGYRSHSSTGVAVGEYPLYRSHHGSNDGSRVTHDNEVAGVDLREFRVYQNGGTDNNQYSQAFRASFNGSTASVTYSAQTGWQSDHSHKAGDLGVNGGSIFRDRDELPMPNLAPVSTVKRVSSTGGLSDLSDPDEFEHYTGRMDSPIALTIKKDVMNPLGSEIRIGSVLPRHGSTFTNPLLDELMDSMDGSQSSQGQNTQAQITPSRFKAQQQNSVLTPEKPPLDDSPKNTISTRTMTESAEVKMSSRTSTESDTHPEPSTPPKANDPPAPKPASSKSLSSQHSRPKSPDSSSYSSAEQQPEQIAAPLLSLPGLRSPAQPTPLNKPEPPAAAAAIPTASTHTTQAPTAVVADTTAGAPVAALTPASPPAGAAIQSTEPAVAAPVISPAQAVAPTLPADAPPSTTSAPQSVVPRIPDPRAPAIPEPSEMPPSMNPTDTPTSDSFTPVSEAVPDPTPSPPEPTAAAATPTPTPLGPLGDKPLKRVIPGVKTPSSSAPPSPGSARYDSRPKSAPSSPSSRVPSARRTPGRATPNPESPSSARSDASHNTNPLAKPTPSTGTRPRTATPQRTSTAITATATATATTAHTKPFNLSTTPTAARNATPARRSTLTASLSPPPQTVTPTNPRTTSARNPPAKMTINTKPPSRTPTPSATASNRSNPVSSLSRTPLIRSNSISLPAHRTSPTHRTSTSVRSSTPTNRRATMDIPTTNRKAAIDTHRSSTPTPTSLAHRRMTTDSILSRSTPNTRTATPDTPSRVLSPRTSLRSRSTPSQLSSSRPSSAASSPSPTTKRQNLTSPATTPKAQPEKKAPTSNPNPKPSHPPPTPNPDLTTASAPAPTKEPSSKPTPITAKAKAATTTNSSSPSKPTPSAALTPTAKPTQKPTPIEPPPASEPTPNPTPQPTPMEPTPAAATATAPTQKPKPVSAESPAIPAPAATPVAPQPSPEPRTTRQPTTGTVPTKFRSQILPKSERAQWMLVRMKQPAVCDACSGTTAMETLDGQMEVFQCDQVLEPGALAAAVIDWIDATNPSAGYKTWVFCADPLCLASQPAGSKLPEWPTPFQVHPSSKVTAAEAADLSELGIIPIK